MRVERRPYARLMEWAVQTEPDVIIGRGYLHRWYLTSRTDGPNLYLHRFLGSDDDRALHDHPWESKSIVIAGEMIEHVGRPGVEFVGWTQQRRYTAGAMVERTAETPHRIEIPEAGECWTLFVTGPKRREWGFWCEHGWRHWSEFVDPNDPNQTGRGCE